MSEMVERVARAIYIADLRLSVSGAMNEARAAIEAMMVPTEAMIEAGRYCDNGEDMNIGQTAAENVWRIMAAEALK